MLKLTNYSLITDLSVATSADSHIRSATTRDLRLAYISVRANKK